MRNVSKVFLLVMVLVGVICMTTFLGYAEERITLADFEADEEWEKCFGTTVSEKGSVTYEIIDDPTIAVSGARVLKVSVKEATAEGWATLHMRFDGMQKWEEDWALSIWIRGDGRPATEPENFGFRLGLQDRDLGNYWAFEPNFTIDNTNTEWVKIEVPMNKFFQWRGWDKTEQIYIPWDWANPWKFVLGIGGEVWLDFSFYIDKIELVKK